MTKQTFTEQYLLDVLKNGHQMGILRKQNEDVYNYILERFPIPEDFPYEIYRIGTKLYAFMIENSFNNYPKDVTGKYITSDPYRNGNIVMDEGVEEITKEYALYALSKITYTVTLQARFPKVWKYIMNNYYIPEDYKYPITKEMLKYMIQNDIHSVPKSEISDEYVQFDSSRDRFRIFASKKESKSKEGNKIIVQKIENTMCERYGVRNSIMIPEVRQKIKETLLEHYGVEHQMYCQEVKDKVKNTCIERYGVPSVGSVQEFIEKKYQTNREKYGVDMPLQNKDIREKASDTLEKRYDVRYALQSKEIREKCHNSFIEHIKSDKEWLMDLVKRIHNSKKENESYGKSKEEDYIFELLCNKFDKSDIYRQYDSDERYPFACDFYIKSLDMFIEYNGFWSHGQHPFLEDNIDDIEKLKLWDSRSEKKIYINAINVWVIRDPLKRKIAKENNLNYVELWTIKEAKSFIQKL